MFGGGFRVGVTVSRVELPSADPGTTPPGAIDRPSRLGDVLPVAVRSDGEIAADLERLVQIRAALAAYEAELVVELAGRRPDSLDIPRGARREAGVDASDPLAAGVSEFFCDEIAVIAQCSPTAATALIEQSFTLRSRLPRVWAALADGLLDHPRARALATELGRPADGTDQSVIAEVEQAVLPHALAGMSVRRLRDLAKKELLARDAAAAERRRKLAERASNVLVRPLADGMAELVAAMPAPAAAAVRDAVDRYAQMLRADGDSHPIGILRAQVLHDLVLRPWDSSRPAVTAHLSILAPLAALSAPP